MIIIKILIIFNKFLIEFIISIIFIEMATSINSKDITCPECGGLCKIKINNYKIKLYECQNDHIKDNISLDQFYKTQKSSIKCTNCNNSIDNKTDKKINMEFFICLTCNKNICSSCKNIHNKEHNVIDYNKSNYICHNHNKNFNSYCNKCKKNLCLICEEKHKKENDIIYFKEMPINNINDLNIIKQDLKLALDKLNNDIKEMIEKLKKVENSVKIYLELYSNIMDNFDDKNMNYQKLNNVNEILLINKKVMSELDKITSESNINKKFYYINDLSDKLYREDKNTIKYKIKKGDTKVKIFGEHFVKTNRNNCRIICDKKEYNLMEYFDIENYNNDKNILEIELKINENLTDMS